MCGKDHLLHDEDVIQIVKLTQAEKAKALHGKKTGARCVSDQGLRGGLKVYANLLRNEELSIYI